MHAQKMFKACSLEIVMVLQMLDGILWICQVKGKWSLDLRTQWGELSDKNQLSN